MKANTLRRASPILALVGLASIVSCAERIIVTGTNNPTIISADAKSIIFDRTGIYIPGVALSDKDRLEMDRVLASYDKSLYRVETYRSGELIKSMGTLPDAFIVEANKLRLKARSQRLNGTALQVGFLIGSRHASPTPLPNGGPGRGIGTRHVPAVAQFPPEPTPQPTAPGQGAGSRHHNVESPPGTNFESTGPEFPGGGNGSRHASEKDIADAERLVNRLKAILQK